MATTYDQIIIGAGFAGLCSAIQLKKNGENNFLILERNKHLGGTWYNNHYPGAACDVESHLYSFSFEPNPNWSREFSPQQEILNYMEHCAAKYELQNHFRFGVNITNAIFDEANGIWNVETENGEKYSAKVIVSCSGGLSQPSFPDIKGLETFKGKMFHSAIWENDFDLTGKTVAVVGTGASAIQIVPAIVSKVKQLNLYQRTPPWILPKPDGEISSLRKWLYNSFPATQRLHRKRLYWQHEIMALGFIKNPGILESWNSEILQQAIVAVFKTKYY
ncbi:MAG: NAD(P)/FAD-dependent oxidoreductase [Bacteroidetes bacterium]|nr:NAD(P)/FAD-dependent oxidoreductase [Bacteroidota bacterium]